MATNPRSCGMLGRGSSHQMKLFCVDYPWECSLVNIPYNVPIMFELHKISDYNNTFSR